MRFSAFLAVSVAAFFAMLTAPVASAADNTTKASSEAKGNQVFVKVKPGDSLSKIADREDTTYQRIFYANTDVKHPDLIFPGQELRMPSDDEKLNSRSIPGTTPIAKPTSVVYSSPVTATPAPAPTPTPQPNQTTNAASGGVWDRLAACESGGNWSINTGNGYYGGLQFSQSSWQAVGGSGLASNASKSEQIARATKLQQIQGWGAWPACSSKLGLR